MVNIIMVNMLGMLCTNNYGKQSLHNFKNLPKEKIQNATHNS